MSFELDKKNILGKVDKSPKGSVDQKVKPLLKIINAHSNYVTTSSCAGRITLFATSNLGNKSEHEWLFVSHTTTSPNKILKSLKNISNNQVWLNQESFIVHIDCKTIEDAQKLITICKKAGLRRAAVISLEKKIIVEIINTKSIQSLIANDEEILVSNSYLKTLINIANKNLKDNHTKLKYLEQLCKKEL